MCKINEEILFLIADDEDLGCESLFSPELNREVNKSDHHSVLHVEQPKKLLSGQKKRKSDKSAEKTEPPDKKTDQKETPKKHQELTKKKLQTVTGKMTVISIVADIINFTSTTINVIQLAHDSNLT